MNIRYVEEFLVFAESLNYSAAAKRLFITRGTLHEHISQLESELCVSLLEKKANGILKLTPVGEQFVADGRLLADSVSGLVDRYRLFRDTSLTLRIGSVDFVWLEPSIYRARKRYLRENPGKSVEFVSVDRGTVEESFAEGSVDIAVASLKTWCSDDGSMDGVVFPHTRAFCVGEEETFLLVPSTHSLYAKNEIRACDLKDDVIVLPKNIADWWKRDGVVAAIAAAGGRASLLGLNFKNLSTYFAYDFDDKIGGVSRTQIARSGVEMRSDFRVMRMSDLPIVSKFYAVFKEQMLENENARRFMECYTAVLAEAQTAKQ